METVCPRGVALTGKASVGAWLKHLAEDLPIWQEEVRV